MAERAGEKKRLIIKRVSEMLVVSGNGNKALASEIASGLGTELGDLTVDRFSDGESQIQIGESMRGKHVFVVQSVCKPVNDNLMDLLIMLDALKRASARRMTAVIPYYGYARQDKKVNPREPITAKLVADLLQTAGAHRVMVMDVHSPSIQGFFNIPVDHLSSLPTVVDYFKKKNIGGKDTVIVSPDVGGVVRARKMANWVNSTIAIISKRRPKPNVAEVSEIIGSVEGMKCMMVDDMVDTAGTLVKGAEMLVKCGAKEVSAYCTHGILSGPAVERIDNSVLKELIITDTIPLSPEIKSPKIKVISMAKVFREAILRAFKEESISTLFLEKK
jgi:ribose-phosphate pyrophosphokinase